MEIYRYSSGKAVYISMGLVQGQMSKKIIGYVLFLLKVLCDINNLNIYNL